MSSKSTPKNNTKTPPITQARSSECCGVDRMGDYYKPPRRSARKVSADALIGAETALCETIKDAKEVLTISYLWEHFGLEGYAAKSCRSPIRSERNASFSVYEGLNGEERFKDHGDSDVQGDSYDFFQLCEGLNASEAFRPFLDLADEVARSGKGESRAVLRSESVKPKPLPPDFAEMCRLRTDVLKMDRPLCEQIAAKRNWKPETIMVLAEEGCLGWDRTQMGGNLAFIYGTGMKLRNWLDSGRRFVWWSCGSGSIWRGEKITNAAKIYLCEGETDCISLLDAGFEASADKAVVAVPSASSFNPAWAASFTGKVVTLCMDGDEAGMKARNRIGTLLHPVVRLLATFNPEEVR